MTERCFYYVNPDLVETEYLHREYALKPVLISSVNSCPNVGLTIVACTDPERWGGFLSTAQRESVIFFLLGNETYDREIYESLSKYSSIKHVFIYNPPRPSSIFGLISVIDWVIHSPKSILDKQLLFAWRFARGIKRQSKQVQLNYSWTNLPLGYTKQFVRQIDVSQVKPGQSLIDSWPVQPTLSSRSRLISFRGQIGTWYRKVLIKYFGRYPNFQYLENSGWSNRDQNGYLNMLKQSTFVLCPPGIYTNETFRYYESVICGSIPIAPMNTLHDFHTSNYWTMVLPWFIRHSHIAVYNYIKAQPWETLEKHLDGARSQMSEEIMRVRDKLDELFYEKI